MMNTSVPLTAKSGSFKPFKYIIEGLDIYFRSFFYYVAICFLFGFIQLIILLIPIINFGGHIVFSILVSGFITFAHQDTFHNMKSFENFFKGFDYAGQIILFRLVMTGFILPFFIAGFVYALPDFSNLNTGNIPAVNSQMFETRMAIFAVSFSVIAAIFYTMYIFVLPLICLAGFNFWQAMESSRVAVAKNIFPVVVFVLLLLLMNAIATSFFFIGLFVSFPASVLAIYAAYKDTFKVVKNDLEEQIEKFGQKQRDVNTETDEEMI